MVGQLVPVVQAAGARGIRRLTPGTAIAIARLAHSRETARNKYPRQMAGYARQSKNYRDEQESAERRDCAQLSRVLRVIA